MPSGLHYYIIGDLRQWEVLLCIGGRKELQVETLTKIHGIICGKGRNPPGAIDKPWSRRYSLVYEIAKMQSPHLVYLVEVTHK